jgi:hypothetical protein
MLGMKTYPQDYIDTCRARVDDDVAAFRKLATAARSKGVNAKALDGAEAAFCNAMVLVLDSLFVHRLRTVEGKDGNPLNEVRVLANSMMHNKNVLTFRRPPTEPGSAETGLKLVPERSVLQLQEGEDIKLTEAQLVTLAKAFFTEIESKYT